jgi:hypothetical protein
MQIATAILGSTTLLGLFLDAIMNRMVLSKIQQVMRSVKRGSVAQRNVYFFTAVVFGMDMFIYINLEQLQFCLYYLPCSIIMLLSGELAS